MKSGAGPPNMARKKRKVGHRHRAVHALQMLGNSHTPEQHAALAPAVHARGTPDELRLDAGKTRGFLGRISLKVCGKGAEVFGAGLDKGQVCQPLVQDDMRD